MTSPLQSDQEKLLRRAYRFQRKFSVEARSGREREFQKLKTHLISEIVGRNVRPAKGKQLKLRPAGAVALELTRLEQEVYLHMADEQTLEPQKRKSRRRKRLSRKSKRAEEMKAGGNQNSRKQRFPKPRLRKPRSGSSCGAAHARCFPGRATEGRSRYYGHLQAESVKPEANKPESAKAGTPRLNARPRKLVSPGASNRPGHRGRIVPRVLPARGRLAVVLRIAIAVSIGGENRGENRG